MKKKLVIGMMISSIFLSSFSYGNVEKNLTLVNKGNVPKVLTEKVQEEKGRKEFNDYAYNFASQVMKSKNNEVCSPASLYLALSVVYDGSTGKTKEATGEFLRLEKDTLKYYNDLYRHSVYKNKDSYSLYNNVIVGNSNEKIYNIKKDFEKKLKKYYKGYVGNLPLAEKKTEEQLSDFIYRNTDKAFKPNLDFNDDTAAVIINTARFKDKWARPMKLEEKGLKFTDVNGKKKTVDAVSDRYSFPHEINKNYESVAIDLYNGYYLVAAKPLNKKYRDFSNPAVLKKMLKDPKNIDDEIMLKIPAFSVTSNIDVKKILEKSGYKRIVSSPNGYPRMLSGGAEISSIIQGAKFDLNEYGIKASAYTMIAMDKMALAPMEPVEMNFDSPFVYALKNPAGDITFMGSYKK